MLAGASAGAAMYWQLSKKLLPAFDGARPFGRRSGQTDAEALARCAMSRWENVPGLAFRDKLSLAIEQVCELAHRPVANPRLSSRKKATAGRAGAGARHPVRRAPHRLV